MTQPRRGEIWWGEAPDTQRPSLSRHDPPWCTSIPANPRGRTDVPRTIRDLPTEVRLGPDEGLPVECAASMDNLLTFPKAMLVRRMGDLGAQRWGEACSAVRTSRSTADDSRLECHCTRLPWPGVG